MEDWAHYSSDDEPSIPHFQLNAVTEALLAELDPTATATQSERAVHRRRAVSSHHEKQSQRKASPGVRSGGKDAPLVGGDSVALGPGFVAMGRPPRRPRKQPDSELDEAAFWIREEVDKGNCEAAGGGTAHCRGNDGAYYHPETRSLRRENSPKPSTPEMESLRTRASEIPVRRVLISPPRHIGRSPPKHSNPSHKRLPQVQTIADEPQPDPAAPLEKQAGTAPVRHRKVVINGISYSILKKLGRGGSGRVYEVMAPDAQTWAFKAIPLAALDSHAKRQIENEVALLQGLRTTERVALLQDWCVDKAKNAIHIVMELGQIDLETIIKNQLERDEKLDPVFVGYYWREMLRCVAALHSHEIVHADIKPANFVLVRGVLKIVDFGIAHGLPDDTVNVYLEHRAGTPSYMAPETLHVLGSSSRSSSCVVRFGKPSDIWSLGCVLHLLVYGQTPFAHVRGLVAKMSAIAGVTAAVTTDELGLGGVEVPGALRRTMGMCLERDPGRRPTAEGLLARSGGDGLVREGHVGSMVVDEVMARMAMEGVKREELDLWLAEAMEEVGLG